MELRIERMGVQIGEVLARKLYQGGCHGFRTTGKFDGKDYPVTGDPTSDARSYKTVNDRTLELTVKKGGKTVASGQITVAADGKSRTVALSGTDATGKKVSTTAVYDKQ